MMTDTPEKSRPRAATSVHNSTPEVFLENSRNVFVLSACKAIRMSFHSMERWSCNKVSMLPMYTVAMLLLIGMCDMYSVKNCHASLHDCLLYKAALSSPNASLQTWTLYSMAEHVTRTTTKLL